MAETTIITGQFVRISQTPASIGERLIALVIDFILIGFYVYATATLLSTLRISSDFIMILIMIVVYLPVLGYSFLCEMFNHGRSFGKNLMNIRVVKADGSTPGISSYLLRWLLFHLSQATQPQTVGSQHTDGDPSRHRPLDACRDTGAQQPL